MLDPTLVPMPDPTRSYAHDDVELAVNRANGIINQLRQQKAKLELQNLELRSALQRIARSVGAGVGEACSHEFHCMVAEEVEAFVKKPQQVFSACQETLERVKKVLNEHREPQTLNIVKR